MDLREIAERINALALEEEHTIAGLQKVRSQFANPRTNKIFSGHTCFHGYAFHHGGRQEVQFNIGVDHAYDQEIFRYGMAFSFQGGMNLRTPLNTIGPRVASFNRYWRSHGQDFADLSMWYHWPEAHGRGRTEPVPASVIPANWVAYGSFIFVGSYLKKSISAVTESDIRTIVQLLDRLLPVYEWIELNARQDSSAVQKTAKICWNKHGWRRPSGPEGKSRDKESYEHRHGYGHEEWLFDFEKLIDGYHYSFLEPINKQRQAYEGQRYNIALYSVDSSTRIWYWIAEIKNAEVIDRRAEAKILHEYRTRGWIRSMYEDLSAVGGDINSFREWEDETLFNIRFRPEDVHWYDTSPVPFEKGEKIPQTRYAFLSRKQAPSACRPPDESVRFSGTKAKAIGPHTRHVSETVVEYSNLHDQIQNRLAEWLSREYPDAAVDLEAETALGTKIDVVLRRKDGTHAFYEVKTCPDAKSSIRAGLGQLLEYAHFPDVCRADSLNIVSHAPASESVRKYVRYLRQHFSLPVRYLQFDHEKGAIIDQE